MSANRHYSAFCCLVFTLLSTTLGWSQMTVTGSIVGNIMDPSGTVVPGAKVTLISQSTKDIREATSNDSGAFSFVAVQPDTYTVKVEHGGFKTFERTHVVISANDHIALGSMPLEIGAVSETVTVKARSPHVQTHTPHAYPHTTTHQ